MVLAAPQEQQCHERHRERDQPPAIFISARLKLVDHQAGIGVRLGDAMVKQWPAGLLHVGEGKIVRVASGRAACARQRADAAAQDECLRIEIGGRLTRAHRDRAVPLDAGELATGLVQPACEFGAVARRGGGDLLGYLATDHTDRREHQEDGKQEQRERRDEPRALAIDVAPGERAGMQDEQRQRAPDLALEMEHAMRNLMPDRAERPVDMRGLTTGMAVRADQRGAAIETERARCMRPADCGRFARTWFERASDQCPRGDVRRCPHVPVHNASVTQPGRWRESVWRDSRMA